LESDAKSSKRRFRALSDLIADEVMSPLSSAQTQMNANPRALSKSLNRTTHMHSHNLSFASAAFGNFLWFLLLPVLAAEPGSPDPAPGEPIDYLERILRSTPLDIDSPAAEATFTRSFRVDPDSLLHLTPVPAVSVTHLQDSLQNLLTIQRSNPSEPTRAKLYYNDRAGLLTVRGTLRELDEIENALATLAIVPPQVMIETRLAEIRGDAIDEELRIALAAQPNALLITAGKLPASSILTENEFRTLIRAIEQKEGIDLISAPKITTLSGRQARISLEGQVSATITDPPFTAPGKSPKAKWSPKFDVEFPKSGN
jgi:hypothetical protein